jgi:hypothetical protein
MKTYTTKGYKSHTNDRVVIFRLPWRSQLGPLVGMLVVVGVVGIMDRASRSDPRNTPARVLGWVIAGSFAAIAAVWLARARTPIVLDRGAGALTRGHGGPVVCLLSWIDRIRVAYRPFDRGPFGGPIPQSTPKQRVILVRDDGAELALFEIPLLGWSFPDPWVEDLARRMAGSLGVPCEFVTDIHQG